MPVYFIRAGETPYVKIGTARDVAKRMKLLQTGSAEQLAVIRTLDGGRFEEGWLHRHFSTQRIVGEWFDYHPDMLAVQVPSLDSRVKVHAEILSIWQDHQALASATGARPEAVKKWRQRGRIPSRYWPKVIVAAAGMDKTITLDMLARAA